MIDLLIFCSFTHFKDKVATHNYKNWVFWVDIKVNQAVSSDVSSTLKVGDHVKANVNVGGARLYRYV